jgi:predicted dithiol-disulfide oxidoreductase (DUF899 family)
MTEPQIVTPQVWLDAVHELRGEEKALTRQLDALSAKRRRLPAVEVDGSYRFTGHDGEVGFLDLFEGRRQLIVYHFMLPPDDDHVCEGCAMFVDQLPHLAHLHARDTSLALVSRAPYPGLAAVRDRMGWTVPWYSSFGSTFNRAMGVTTDDGESFALSVFLRDGDSISRTYVTDGRGVETLGTVWSLLDRTPFGRQETWQDAPPGRPQGAPYAWWRLHDDYDVAGGSACGCSSPRDVEAAR